MAVGSAGDKVFAETFNGRWRLTPMPKVALLGTDDGLASVSCVSRNYCVAVGNRRGHTNEYALLGEVWNGKTWIQVSATKTGPSADFHEVACETARHCVVVGGSYTEARAESISDDHWRETKVPSPSTGKLPNLLADACWSSGCLAVGSVEHGPHDAPLAARWNGHEWVLTPQP